ncbi:MAG: hypothetical protein AB7S70_11940 [Hyphomicrobium sp.]|uniref:hypothetical protein n=1 Tax=Hyphomicrobium sp. TaxID=82 RepID=UPI003D0BDBCA
MATKHLGPTFADAVVASELLRGAPFTWGSDGDIGGRETLTTEQNAALDALIAAHDPDAPVVPQAVTPYQARRALDAAGLRDAAEAAIAAADYDVRDAWEYALTIERNSPFIAALAPALGLSSEQIDALFIAAAAY